MEMNIQTKRELVLRVLDDHEEGIFEVDAFLSSLLKIRKMINRVGFLNKFTKEEKVVWNNFFEIYNIQQETPENPGPNVQNINNLQQVDNENQGY